MSMVETGFRVEGDYTNAPVDDFAQGLARLARLSEQGLKGTLYAPGMLALAYTDPAIQPHAIIIRMIL